MFERQTKEFKTQIAAVKEQQEAAGQKAKIESVKESSEAAGQQDEPDRYAIFDTMSSDWGDEADGFIYHEIPEEYTDTGGYFPEKMQCYTYILCKQYGVDYSLVVALIERESGYRFDRVGDDGNSYGYMQIYGKWHTDRMEELNCTDLMNPYQNVMVGIDYLASLIEKYKTAQDALTAYNYGEQGAREHLWGKEIYSYSYNASILNRAKQLEEEWNIEEAD